MNRSAQKKRRFQHLSCLLMSRLPRSARERIYFHASLEALSRLRQCHTQAVLATLLGTSIWVIRGWEKGRRQPCGPVQMAILMLEGVLSEWPAGRLPRDDWREKLWGYPITAILTYGKAEQDEEMIDDYLKQFEASSPETKSAIIGKWEEWLQQLKNIT